MTTKDDGVLRLNASDVEVQSTNGDLRIYDAKGKLLVEVLNAAMHRTFSEEYDQPLAFGV